ncbi:MAG: RNA-binding protein [Synechococcaceae cyanobacterium RL_1_2]|nr:RNA-binding protein [Synechococcaceae cyanobacterium RL_1_2]
MTIYVGNLAYSVQPNDLKEVFAEYGTVTRVSIPTDRETGRSRGFGFVDLDNDDQEDKVIETLDGAEWMERELRVSKAKPKS